MSKGKVFCCYPATGKTSSAGQVIVDDENRQVVDLETSLMKTEGWTRPDNWVQIYCNYVEDIINQGIHVFCSTHKDVREELDKRGVEYITVFPSLNIEDWWLCRLRDRWKEDPSPKNLNAYERAMSYYEEDIEDLCSHKKHVEINVERGYDLIEVLSSYVLRNTDSFIYN